ncbi:Vir protein [Legionella sp. CNM-4043-24]|uniref:Vir protein n=1 Tax=Legionella sp. CNM-4043-24 TaxID=3421646 RepID=UPI00403B2C27
MDSLFLRLAAMYGHIWRSLYKSEEFLAFTKNEWAEGLMRFDDAIIEKSLAHCCNHWEYPPTLPQFVECCKAYSVQAKHETPIKKFKPASQIVANTHLSKIKSILNMNH